MYSYKLMTPVEVTRLNLIADRLYKYCPIINMFTIFLNTLLLLLILYLFACNTLSNN